MTENLHTDPVDQAWRDYVDAAIAADLVFDRIAISRSLGVTRETFQQRYEGHLHAAAGEWDTDTGVIARHVEAIVDGDVAYYNTLIQRGRPADAAPLRNGWVATIIAEGRTW